MANIDRYLDSLTSQLEKYTVNEQGLSFSGKSLKLNTSEDAEIIANEIDSCENLASLNMDGNTLGIDAAKRISDSLSKHPEFKHAIWKNMFTGRTKEEIPPALTHLGTGIIKAAANLIELDLSDNAFGPIGVEGLQNLINSPSFHSLQILRLNNNGLGITGGQLLAKSLKQCYENSDKKFALRVFQAGRNRLENPGAQALAGVFKMLGTLVEVSMPQNGIYANGVIALSAAFKNNPHLKILNLNDNTVQEKGATALAEALPCLQKLETLNLGDCLLKTKGATSIVNALAAKHEYLQNLYLDHNEINAEGGMEIAKAMHNKNALINLNLNGNCFGEKGIKRINLELIKMKKETTLQSFSEDEGVESEQNDSIESCDEQSESLDTSNDNDTSNDGYGDYDNHVSTKVTVSEFLNEPNGSNLKALEMDNFKNYLQTSEDDSFVKNTLELLFAVSNLTSHKELDVAVYAAQCSLGLYQHLFDWAEKNDRLSLVTNSLLVQLRLIKAEEKGALLDCNIKNCLGFLSAIVNANDTSTIPKWSLDMIGLFLKRNNTS